MRLVTFDAGNGPRLGVETSSGIIDVRLADPNAPADLLDLLQRGDRTLVQRIADDPPARARVDSASVRRLPPVLHPQKLICIGLNYRDHAAEVKMDLPTHAAVFAKWGNVLVGDGAPVVVPSVSDQVDYEAELAFVVGRRARHVRQQDAYDYVAGYTAFNDVSVRDYQLRTTQWTMGKNFDTHGPCGPALVTTDEIPDPHVLAISCSVNGEVLQSSNTGEMVFTVARLLADLSGVMTLEPGDMVATGTPAGVGMSRKPQRWLRPGDRVRVEIERIGAIENPLVAEAG